MSEERKQGKEKVEGNMKRVKQNKEKEGSYGRGVRKELRGKDERRKKGGERRER